MIYTNKEHLFVISVLKSKTKIAQTECLTESYCTFGLFRSMSELFSMSRIKIQTWTANSDCIIKLNHFNKIKIIKFLGQLPAIL